MKTDTELGRLCFFFDVDGTLIDIADRPELVVVPESLKHHLSLISEQTGGAVALISGRTIANLDRLFEPVRLRASGVHGAELRDDPGGDTWHQDGNALPLALVSAVRDVSARSPGTFVENKVFSVALHYRGAPALGPVLRSSLENALDESGVPGLRLMPGHMVFEVKRATFDKGLAISHFLTQAPFASRRPIFVGDDVTDEPGFETVIARGGIAYSVGRTFPGVSATFADPAAVRTWLSELVELERSQA